VVNQAEGEVKDLADRDADSVNSNIRYMAYGSRLRTALMASTRYVAYVRFSHTSYRFVFERLFRRAMLARRLGLSCTRVLSLLRTFSHYVIFCGISFFLNALNDRYGISWLYLTGDVGYEAYKAYRRGPSALDQSDGFSERTRIGMVAVQRAVFQSIASM